MQQALKTAVSGLSWVNRFIVFILAFWQTRRNGDGSTKGPFPFASPNAVPVPPPEVPVPPDPPPPLRLEPDFEASKRNPPPLPAWKERKVKWLTPGGEKPLPMPKVGPPKPKLSEPKPKRPKVLLNGDPEEFGQYYFRDQILDQLDRYFFYLARMKRSDRSSYDLLRQVGMQIVPHSAIDAFDRARYGFTTELSPWWKLNRPSFGAVAYGFDAAAEDIESCTILETADPNDPRYHYARGEFSKDDKGNTLRKSLKPLAIGKGSIPDRKPQDAIVGIMWVPRFLYFYKYKKPPDDIEVLPGGDIYKLTIYWDRATGTVSLYRKRRTGVPQDYGVWVGHGTGEVKILRSRLTTNIVINYPKGPHGGTGGYHKPGPKQLPGHTYWTVPDEYLAWSHREGTGLEPSDYLRRLFIEAADLYATAAMSSMIRVAASKGSLTAAFGVEIKRTSYFFKDRDVQLTQRGVKKRIFHVVRPHVRKDGAEVPMHFRGLREFEWAGYRISISVPGRDHFVLPEIPIGLSNFDPREKIPKGMAGMKNYGTAIKTAIREGVGRSRP